MAYNKVVYNGKTLIDLTKDTVTTDVLKKGFTTHRADGTIITGTYEGVSSDDIDYILLNGFTTGNISYVDNGQLITITNNDTKQILTKQITNSVCTTILKTSAGVVIGKLIKTHSNNGLTITYEFTHNGKKTVKEFSDESHTMTERTTDSSGKIISSLIKQLMV